MSQNSMCVFLRRHLPALGESLSTLVGAMPVAFLEPDLNAYNPLSVFNTKTPRERASMWQRLSSVTCVNHWVPWFWLKCVITFLCSVLSMPDTVEEMCPEMPRLDKLLKDVNDISESGARYNDMPQVPDKTPHSETLTLKSYVNSNKYWLCRSLK